MYPILLSAALVAGQCPGGSCAVPAFGPTYHTVQHQFDGWVDLGSGQHALFRGGKQLGNWHAGEGYWRPYLGGNEWGAKSPRAPEEPPGGYVTPDAGLVGPPEPPGLVHGPDGQHLFTGVDPEKIKHDEPFTLGGKSVSRETAVQAIVSAGSLTDDSGKPFLVLVGPADWRTTQQALVTPEIAAACHVQGYSGDEQIVADVGYAAATLPRVYLTDAGGKVLWTAQALDPTAVMGALRKKRPDWDPSKLLSGLGLDLGAVLGAVPGWAWLAGGGVVLFLLFGKRKAG